MKTTTTTLTLEVLQSLDDGLLPGSVWSLSPPGGTLGRAPEAAVSLPSGTVSRQHARLRAAGGGWEVAALTRTNGTFLDGRALPPGAWAPLPVGARLQVGGVLLGVVPGEDTRPVLTPLGDAAPEPVLSAQWDGSMCTIRCQGRRLPLEPQPARALAALLARPGVTIHRWDILDAIGDGPGVNLDRCMSKVRRALREAVEGGLLPRPLVEAAVAALDAEPASLSGLDNGALMRRFVASRRGHGYLLCLSAEQVCVSRE